MSKTQFYSDVLPKLEEHLVTAQNHAVECQSNLLEYARKVDSNFDVCNSRVLRLLCAHFIDAHDKYQALLSERDSVAEVIQFLS